MVWNTLFISLELCQKSTTIFAKKSGLPGRRRHRCHPANVVKSFPHTTHNGSLYQAHFPYANDTDVAEEVCPDKAEVSDCSSTQRSIQPNPSSRTAKDRKHISTGLYGDGKYLVSRGPLHIQVWSFDEETPLADEGTEYYRKKKQTNARVRKRRRSSAAAQAQRRLAGEAEQRISKPLPPDGHIPYLLSRTDF